jgi:hypothetical protein
VNDDDNPGTGQHRTGQDVEVTPAGAPTTAAVVGRQRRRKRVAMASGATLGAAGLIVLVLALVPSGSTVTEPRGNGATASASAAPTESPTPSTAPGAVPATAPPTSLPPDPTVPPTTGSPVRSDIKVYGDCTTPTFEPTQIIQACGDGNLLVKDLRWSTWTATQATAIGTVTFNGCTPTCAEGQSHDVPNTTVTLTTPVRDHNGQLVWSKMNLSPALADGRGSPGDPLSLAT